MLLFDDITQTLLKPMLYKLKGSVALLLAVLNVLIMAVPFFSAVLLKILFPFASTRRFFTGLVTLFARQYNRNNGLIFGMMSQIHWVVEGLQHLEKDGSYLVVANHQSWADIPILQSVIEPHAPLLKFFIKKELIWVPVLGAAWWALDFPFMKRYSREFLEKHPEKRGEDVRETKKMCERFKDSPVSVMSFLEGTRFTPRKKEAQQSPYKRLLKPKVGGVALVINSMGDSIKTMIDVTINYHSDHEVTIWHLFSGQLKQITVDIRAIPIPEHFAIGDYENDPVFRKEIQGWIGQVWSDKDQKLAPQAA